MSYTNYQLKSIIEQWLEKHPHKTLKGWKSAPKAKLYEILQTKKIKPAKYNIPSKNPNPPAKAVGNVLNKYGVKLKTPEEQEEYIKEIEDRHNPLKPLKPYINKLGRLENIKLLPHQENFIKQFVYSNLRGAVAFHGVGSGKTLTAVVSSYLYLQMFPENKVIVISPSALLYNFVNGMQQFGLDINDNRYSFYTYDKFIRQSNNINTKNSLIIIDEAHNFRTQITTSELKDEDNEVIINKKTGEALKEAQRNKRGYKLMENGTKHAHKVLLLTGTAFVNGLYDIENLLAMIDRRDPITPDDFQRVITNGENIIDYFNYKISYYKTSPKSIFFPEVHDKIEPIYMTEQQEKQYNLIKQEGRPDSKSDKPNNFYNAELYANNAISGNNNPKVNWVIKKIVDNPSQKFIVYSTLYESGVKLLTKMLDAKDIEYTTITGKQTTKGKEEAKLYFNGYNFNNEKFFDLSILTLQQQKYINNKFRVLIITKAGAEGVDTINCQNVILLNSLWNDATSEQIIARAVRYQSHFGLPEKERYVNVFRLLLAKWSNREVINTLLQPNFKDFCNLKKQLSEATKEHINLLNVSQGNVKVTVKLLKSLKNNDDTPYIPEKTKYENIRGGIGKKNKLMQRGPDGWDKYNELTNEGDKVRWMNKIYSEWVGMNKQREESKKENPIIKGLVGCTADLLMYIMAKSKTENIEDFCALIGNDISVFEKYESAFLEYIKTKEVNGRQNLTEKEQAQIYATMFREVEQHILGTQYTPTIKKERSKEEQLQEFFTNAVLAKDIVTNSSIIHRDDKITVLEPTAGDGALIRPILELEKDITIDLVEINRTNRKELEKLINGPPHQPALFLKEQPNFLKYTTSTRYDYIFMNPPFHLKASENGNLNKDIFDFDFIKRAYAYLKVGGELIAISGGHYTTNKEMIKWYNNKNAKITVEKATTFKPLNGKKGAKVIPHIIKIIKKNSDEDNNILKSSEKFYKNYTPELGKEILNNEVPISDIIKPHKKGKKQKEVIV